MKHLMTFESYVWFDTPLFEGGSFGHMQHPYDDHSLTFGELKEMIDHALDGQLDKEVVPTEKLDGQAISISWKDGKLIAARNKGDRKNFGANAPTVQGVIDKFAGRGDLSDAFSLAVQDLESAVSGLSETDKLDIFGDGKKFMHLEIIYPASVNVISYDVARLIFHNITEYDEKGNPVAEDKHAARRLQKMIKAINADIQKTFTIAPPLAIKIPKHTDFEIKQDYFLRKVSRIQKTFGLKDEDTIGDYFDLSYEKLIMNMSKKYGYSIPDETLSGLVERWAHGDNSYNLRVLKKAVDNDKFLEWALDFDKKGNKTHYKEIVKPFELMFLELGSTIMKNAIGFLAANPDETVQRIRKDIEKTLSDIKKSDDVEMLKKVEDQLHKIEAIGGFESIVPSEGIVFQYKGKTFKLTGAFAPINQLLGILRYAR